MLEVELGQIVHSDRTSLSRGRDLYCLALGEDHDLAIASCATAPKGSKSDDDDTGDGEAEAAAESAADEPKADSED